MRRGLVLAAVLVALVATGVGLVPADAGSSTGTVVTVRKTVVGTATGPFSVVISCSDDEGASPEVTLNFDATGAPTTVEGGAPFMIVGGAWVADSGTPDEPLTCTANETDADGADSTSWTCAYESTPAMHLNPDDSADDAFIEGGCDAASGTGTGPVGFTLASELEVETQAVTVDFTNTIAEPDAAPATAAVEAQPAFTG